MSAEEKLLARLNAIKKCVHSVAINALVVDSSALVADDDLGARVWPLYWEDDGWHHYPSGTVGTLGEQLNGIASACLGVQP